MVICTVERVEQREAIKEIHKQLVIYKIARINRAKLAQIHEKCIAPAPISRNGIIFAVVVFIQLI